MGYVEQAGDAARVWYARQREDDQREEGYWYCETKLEARVLRDRLLADDNIVETGIEVKHDGTWWEEN